MMTLDVNNSSGAYQTSGDDAPTTVVPIPWSDGPRTFALANARLISCNRSKSPRSVNNCNSAVLSEFGYRINPSVMTD
uniref:Uncharacterized protein n=1 Tax=Trichogramma kaykai TaxID=54128 RepID=A0ABD2X9Y1_9HYME